MDEPVKAFGAETSPARYRLRLLRYVDLAERIRNVASRRDSPPRLLDLGVGKGRLKLYYPKEGPPVEWIGIDIQTWRLEAASKVGGWRLVRGDGTRLPFDDGAFDIVVCSQVLEHFEDSEGALREAGRVLSPEGTLLLSLPVFPPGFAFLARVLVSALLVFPPIRKRWHGHVRFFSTHAIRRMVGKEFRVRDIRGFRFLSVLFLENFRFFFRLNRWFGRVFPSLSVEVNVEASKR
ncbi:MAG: class I SAM-dependent methyltransferase [Planctomycetota bacterium]|jgi:ubiquinone/menaquinone biosynthesis C-methylase UbiE